MNKTSVSIKNATLKNISEFLPKREKSSPKSLKYPALKNVAKSKNELIRVNALPDFIVLKTYFKISPNTKNNNVSDPKIITLA